MTACRSCGGTPTSMPVLVARGDAARERAADARAARRARAALSRSTWCSARSARWCRSPRPCRRRSCSATTSTSLRSPTRMLAHAQAHRRAADRERGARARQPGGRGRQQRRLPAAVLPRAGIPVLGIEPARQHRRGRPRRARHPDARASSSARDLARELGREGTRADVIHANNVLAHVADLNGFVEGFARCSRTTGVVVIEAPTSSDFIDNVEFDTIYHEHLCYFSLTALDHLFRGTASTIVDVERIPIHGGSLRLFVRRRRPGNPPPAIAVTALLEEERKWGVRDPAAYRISGVACLRLRDELMRTLAGPETDGARIAAYGASAKGSTLLNYFGIGADLLDFVVDRSTDKQGRSSPRARTWRSMRRRCCCTTDAGLRTAADMELRRRNSRAAGSISPRRRRVHHSDSASADRLIARRDLHSDDSAGCARGRCRGPARRARLVWPYVVCRRGACKGSMRQFRAVQRLVQQESRARCGDCISRRRPTRKRNSSAAPPERSST